MKVLFELISPDRSSEGLEKRAGNVVRGYLWTANCNGEHWEWFGNGCFSYRSNGVVKDMYSVLAKGQNCKLEFFENGQCAFLWGGSTSGSNICGYYGNNEAFQSIRVNCD